MYTWGECQVLRVFRLLKMLLDLVLFCCFLCVFPIRERFVLPKFVFCHEFGLYCFCCALSRSCRYHSKFRRFKPICFLVLFVLVVEMHHSILIQYPVKEPSRSDLKYLKPIKNKFRGDDDPTYETWKHQIKDKLMQA